MEHRRVCQLLRFPKDKGLCTEYGAWPRKHPSSPKRQQSPMVGTNIVLYHSTIAVGQNTSILMSNCVTMPSSEALAPSSTSASFYHLWGFTTVCSLAQTYVMLWMPSLLSELLCVS